MASVSQFERYIISCRKQQPVSLAGVTGPGKYVGLYFSGHWCPPCQAFTAELKEWYNAFKATKKGQSFEIIFISSDMSQESFDEYAAEMPWLALEYGNREAKKLLCDMFNVASIPALVIVDGCTGSLVTNQGRQCVLRDKKGKKFPWKI